MKNITERVRALREWMKQREIAAFIIPSSDPHNSEYTAEHWKCREWISGFDGSAGLAVVTLNAAALWTDSRYFLQAEQQLNNTPFVLMREGLPETPAPQEWLEKEVGTGFVACNEEVFTKAAYDSFNNEACSYRFAESCDPFAELWKDRPAIPSTPVYRQPERFTGESVAEKIEKIWSKLENMSDFTGETTCADYFLVSDLSEIAWVLNLRASDVEYNPVFISYLLIGRNKSILFTDLSRVSEEIKSYLYAQNTEVAAYDGLIDFIGRLTDESATIGITPQTPQWICSTLADKLHIPHVYLHNPLPLLRSIKNEAEKEGFRQAMLQDGVALVRFHRWLDEKIENGTIADETEHSVAQRLKDFRAQNHDFIDSSFATIAGYGANGAIVHYESTAEYAARLQNYGLLLLDSGAQYLCGTTDITRTIPLGRLTEEEKKVYTLVLKGHIALSRARFPKGTTGLQLDTAARMAMWHEGYDFGHGTGHGVGSHLCVHEGPQQIRKDLREATRIAFETGMTITNEPGIYVAGKFGVRIENVLLVGASETTDFGTFHRFETLTLCPIDIAPIHREMLEESERIWLNDYHKRVRERLLPLLNDETDRNWLIAATKEI